ncbi:RcnB family protein [[Pantoea] beijingensis]|nr:MULTISPECIES: RcnB family protein [Erwiniaceae]
MSKTIVFLSAVLLSALPAISTAYAEGQEPLVQNSPDATAQADIDAQNQGVTSSGQTPDVQTPAEHDQDDEGKPDPAHPYAVKTFFADFQRFSIGSIVPDRYRTRQYQVVDWKTRNLPQPTDGTHWTYMGGNYVLITEAEGKIVQAESGEIFYQQ